MTKENIKNEKYNTLNEFEKDYATAPFRDKKTDADFLSGKNILVIGKNGNGLANAVTNMLIAGNCVKKLDISVDFVDVDMFVNGDCLEKCEKEYEYIIITGYANFKPNDFDIENSETIIKNICISASKIKGLKRILYFSDYRIYGKAEDNMRLAEYERINNKENLSPEGKMMIRLEELIKEKCRVNNIQYVILRLAAAFGPYVDLEKNIIYRLAELVAEGKSTEISADMSQMSFIYINDIMTATLFALGKASGNKVYNAASTEQPVNVEELICMIRKEFPKNCRITFKYESDKNNNFPVPMSSSKLSLLGWKQSVSLRDGIIILIKSMINSNEIFIFDNSYQGKLTTVHNILLEYLLYIDKICKKHNIKYFLAGGTLLGAVRHHGFIPWDDDADVMMLREDYDRFLEVIKDELPKNVFLQLPGTDPLNHQPFIKLRLDDTVFATKFTSKFPEMHNGIFIDILAHDKTSDSRIGQKKHIFMTLLTRSMVFNKWGDTPITLGGRHPILCRAATFLKNHLPMKFLEKRMFNTLEKYKNKDTDFLYDGMGRNLRRGVFPKKWLDEAVLMDFEGYKLPVPKDYDEYLTWLYGNYMEMVPVSERRTSHSIVWMDLGEYADYRVGENLFDK